MEKFNRVLRGYDPVEVNNFLDSVIKQVEKIIEESRSKEQRLNELSSLVEETNVLKEKLKQYENMESTLTKAIMMAQKTSDQMRMAAHNESSLVIDDAKKNANRIINEALMRAEKTEFEASMLRRNINIFKRRIREIIEAQLEVVNEIEKVEL